MSIIGTIHEDITTDVLGVIGSWQWLITFITMVCTIFPTINQYEDALLLKPPSVVESIKSGTDDIIINSTMCTADIKNGTILKYKKWRIQLMGLIWMKRSWLVHCDPKIKKLSISVISRLGSTFGFIIFGVIADSFGRKLTMKLGVIAELGLRLILIFCDSESWIHLVIFLRSLFASGNTYLGIVLICEISSNEWRTQLNTVVILPRVLAALFFIFLANLAPNTETLDLISCIFSVFYLILLRWLPESPQWLLYNEQIPTTEKLLSQAAKRNGITLSSIFKIRPVNHKAYIVLDETRTCVGILATYNIRILILTLTLFWCFYYFVWSSLYLRVYTNETERYKALKLLCLVTVMSFLNICLTKKLKLRKLLVMNLMIVGVLETLLTIFQHLMFQGIMTNLILSLSLSTCVIVQVLTLNITPRLLAVNVRATLFGLCHSAGQLGAIVCYVVMFLNAIDNVSLAIMNVMLTIVLAFLCSILPDVDGRELPDVLEDMDYFSELSKPLRWAAQKTNSPSHEEIEMRVYSFNSAIQNFSTRSHSAERIPARKIGFQQLHSILKLFICCRK